MKISLPTRLSFDVHHILSQCRRNVDIVVSHYHTGLAIWSEKHHLVMFKHSCCIVARGSHFNIVPGRHFATFWQFDRYLSRDRKMLGWDRTVGNMLEQSVPFLGLFWLNIYLSSYGGLSYVYITAAGWLYVGIRSLYPVSDWFWLAIRRWLVTSWLGRFHDHQ